MPNEIEIECQRLLGKEIARFSLMGTGAVNDAYRIECVVGTCYIVKKERAEREFTPQNDLAVEAKIAQLLHGARLSISVPKVAFICEDPKMYAYEYIEGNLMRDEWGSLSEEEKVRICRQLGAFHAEIGRKVTKEMAEEIGAAIDMSSGLHPEVAAEYEQLLQDARVPEHILTLAKRAKQIFDTTQDGLVFQFLHNDSHPDNILVNDGSISGIIDFGEAKYGEAAQEFSRYIRDIPGYFQHIVAAYEEGSGSRLSGRRLVSNSFLSGLIDIVEDHWKGGADRDRAEKAVEVYESLLRTE